METIDVKEGLLSKVESNIEAERIEWDSKLAKDRASVATEREAAKERVRSLYAEAKTKLASKTSAFELEQKEAADDLESKAQQLELLHSQLLKLQSKLSSEKAEFDQFKHQLCT